jgi:hypothetical protein
MTEDEVKSAATEIWGNMKARIRETFLKMRQESHRREVRRVKSAYPNSRAGKRNRFYG